MGEKPQQKSGMGTNFQFALCFPISETNRANVLVIENPYGHIGGMGTNSLKFRIFSNLTLLLYFISLIFVSVPSFLLLFYFI